jgi:nucleoside transporter
VNLASLLLAVEAAPLSTELRIPLSVMNFLEFAIWGAWWVVLGQYLETLKFSRKQIGRVYATMAVGAIVAPMFLGFLVDKYFSAQYVLGALHLLGSGLLLSLALTRKEKLFYWIALLYAFCYQPTISLANNVVFGHLPDSARDYPSIRVLGTIGWITAGLSLKLLIRPGKPVNNRPILVASALSLALGCYSFFLPNTPPKGTGTAFPFIDALKLFQNPTFAVFFASTLVVAGAFAFYFAFTSIYLEKRIGIRADNVVPVMTLGQWVEIGGMVLLPYLLRGGIVPDASATGILASFDQFLARVVPPIGMKAVLMVGIAAVAARYALFAAGRPFWAVVLAIALHGICFDFFLAAGFIFVDTNAPKEIQGSAQALFLVLTYGLGTYFGTEGAGFLNQKLTREAVNPATGQVEKVTDWRTFWLVPTAVATITAVVFWLMFNPPAAS